MCQTTVNPVKEGRQLKASQCPQQELLDISIHIGLLRVIPGLGERDENSTCVFDGGLKAGDYVEASGSELSFH